MPRWTQKVAALYPTHLDSKDFPPIVFDKITLDDKTQLPQGDRQRLIAILNGTAERSGPGSLDEVNDVYIAGFLQDLGYFRSDPRARFETLPTDASGAHVELTVFPNERLQYRMGRLSFRSSEPDVPLAFTQDALGSRFYLREGDIFAVSKIRATLDDVKKLYASHGYIDFGATPVTEIHGGTQRIDVTLEIDQQKQFRVNKVTVETVSPEVHTAANTALAPGSI